MFRSFLILSVLVILAVACAAPAGAPAPAPTVALAQATTVPAPTTAPAQPTTAPTAVPVEPTIAAAAPLKIVASTTWVGAFAKAAGATDITVIAPANLQHPPDYDPKPSDLAAIQAADYVLYAGFEGFAPRLQEAVGGDASKLITVATENSPEAIRAEVTRLGELFGTQEAAAAWLAEFDAEYAHLAGEIQTKLGDQKPVIVAQVFATPWVKLAGLEPAGTYGPMPLTPVDLKTLSDSHPTFVFENYHMGGGQPVVEATGAAKVDLLNFPDASLDLLPVFQENAKRIETALDQVAVALPTVTAEAHHEMAAPDPFAVRVGQYYLDTAGFHDMATVLSDTQKIDLSFRTRVARVKKILAQMPLPADLAPQGQEFNQTLEDFSIALRDDKVQDAITLGDEVHDAQHELSHVVDEWLATNPAKSQTVDPFNISLSQYYLDTAGFHDMATVLSDTQKIDSAYLTKVNRVNKVLQQTTWPDEVNAPAQAFLGELDTFATALRDEKVEDAVAASEAVHDAQHDLSHEISAWLDTNPPKATEPGRFQISIAQYYLDTAGFHDMATVLSDTKKIDPAYLTTVTRVSKLLKQTTWSDEVKEQAQAFITALDAFAIALKDEKVEDAIEASETVHDAQHELSHTIDEWSGGEAADH